MENESREEALGVLLADTGNLLEELYQSGFGTVHDSTLDALKKMTELTEQYGMSYLSELVGKLTEGLSMRRHQIEKKAERSTESLAKLYKQINEYLYICEEKMLYDKGRVYYED